MSYAFLCALKYCHVNVFAAQGPSESDFYISSTWPWRLGPKSSPSSPTIAPRWSKMDPSSPQVLPR